MYPSTNTLLLIGQVFNSDKCKVSGSVDETLLSNIEVITSDCRYFSVRQTESVHAHHLSSTLWNRVSKKNRS